jgi:hypothetical protein
MLWHTGVTKEFRGKVNFINTVHFYKECQE